MKGHRTRRQFRLTWQRAANGDAGFETPMEKSKTFASRKQAERHIRILTSAEPWREWAPDDGPEGFVCCPGGAAYECGCGGMTHAEKRDETRKDLPPITWIRIEERQITSTPFVQVEMTVFGGPKEEHAPTEDLNGN